MECVLCPRHCHRPCCLPPNLNQKHSETMAYGGIQILFRTQLCSHQAALGSEIMIFATLALDLKFGNRKIQWFPVLFPLFPIIFQSLATISPYHSAIFLNGFSSFCHVLFIFLVSLLRVFPHFQPSPCRNFGWFPNFPGDLPEAPTPHDAGRKNDAA